MKLSDVSGGFLSIGLWYTEADKRLDMQRLIYFNLVHETRADNNTEKATMQGIVEGSQRHDTFQY